MEKDKTERSRELRETLIYRLNGVSIEQLPLLAEWVETGDKTLFEAYRRRLVLTELYELRGREGAAPTRESAFVRDFLKLMYLHFPGEPIWQDEELRGLVSDGEDGVIDE